MTLLREIRAGETAVPPHTVVIMASGDHRLKAESLASGANRFMLKPLLPQYISNGTVPSIIRERT
ncbi:MAG: hypothetical protein M5U34_44495 [Chloroflexi bacterium]|nr:hypothetical protein [Chloroflexota bacterium]